MAEWELVCEQSFVLFYEQSRKKGKEEKKGFARENARA